MIRPGATLHFLEHGHAPGADVQKRVERLTNEITWYRSLPAAQRAAKAAIYETTGDSPDLGHGIDGCSAPNFAMTLTGEYHDLGRFLASIASLPTSFG